MTRKSSNARRYLALAVATWAFAANFCAWSLISPLAPRYRDLLDLGPTTLSVLVAIPVLIGSLGRIPLGALTDRYGGRIVFAVLSAVGIVPVLFLATTTSYGALLAGGLVLGITGASFAVGVPFVNAWFPPERRGFALGIYGMGNVGTSVAGLLAPRVWDAAGRPAPYLLVALLLAVTSVFVLLVGRNPPGSTPSTESFTQRFVAAVRLRATVELAALYAITFGGFVAFGVYLPTYLVGAYGLTVGDAALRAAGFVLLATLARPAGGWLADLVGGPRVLAWALAGVATLAVVAAFTPAMPVLTTAMLLMAAALGVGNGAVFALLSKRIPAPRVGAATGIVGAAGGLGGFLPPLVMGLVYQATGSYAIGFMLLSDVALAGLVFTLFGLSAARTSRRSEPPTSERPATSV